MANKVCASCKAEKERFKFHKDKSFSDGRHPYCKECRRRKSRKYNERRAEKNRENALKRKYGIDLADYDELLARQDGKCAICRVSQNDLTRKLAVDHDHMTMKIRGLLCLRCNTAIGKFNDDPELMNRAIDYILDGGF